MTITMASGYHRLSRRQGQPAPRQIVRHGWSRVDFVVALGAIAVLATLTMLWLGSSRGESRRTHCERRQITIARAAHLYASAQREYPGYVQPWSQEESAPPQSWAAALLPWLDRPLSNEERSDRQHIDMEQRGPFAPLADELQAAIKQGQTAPSGRFLPAYLCPADPRWDRPSANRRAWLGYVVNAGQPDKPATADQESQPPDLLANGLFLDYLRDKQQRSSPQYLAEHDGAEFTLLATENIDAGEWLDGDEAKTTFLWTTPPGLAVNEQAGRGDGTVRFARPSSGHRGGVMAVFAGENTRFLDDRIDPVLLRRWMTSDEETAENPPADRR